MGFVIEPFSNEGGTFLLVEIRGSYDLDRSDTTGRRTGLADGGESAIAYGEAKDITGDDLTLGIRWRGQLCIDCKCRQERSRGRYAIGI
jgi:hypothetical protein